MPRGLVGGGNSPSGLGKVAERNRACSRRNFFRLADALRPLFAESRGAGAVEYYVTERSAAFDEIVRVMDGALDPAAIRVENAFIL